MVNEKILEGMEELLCSELKRVIKQDTINGANEAKSVKDVLESLEIIQTIRNGMMSGGMDEGYAGYAPRTTVPLNGYSGNNNLMRGNVHGDVNGNMHGNMPDYAYGSSYGRRRSSTTGRYMSSGYSGHSIKDRMIASLEALYDDAGSQHEQTEIDNWINKLRSE